MSDFDYILDITFCIDISINMEGVIDNVKKHIGELPRFIQDQSILVRGTIPNMRVKIMTFGNFDEGIPISHSRWFCIKGYDSMHNSRNNKLLVSSMSSLSDYESIEFKRYVNNIHLIKNNAINGSNGLEVLSQAIKTDWMSNVKRGKRLIIIYTLNKASKLEDSNRSINIYPNENPFTLNELTDIWLSPSIHTEGLNNASKCLIVFAPQYYPWPEIYETWDRVLYNPSAYDSLDELLYQDIFDFIFPDV